MQLDVLIFFLIFNNPITFAASPTKIIYRTSEAETMFSISYFIFPFSVISKYWDCAFCFSLESDSLTAHVSSMVGKAFLRLKSTVCLRNQTSQRCLEGSEWMLQKALPDWFTFLFNSKQYRTHPYGCRTHFSSSQSKTTFEWFIASWKSGPF